MEASRLQRAGGIVSINRFMPLVVMPLVVLACGVAGCGGQVATSMPDGASGASRSQDRNGVVRERNVVRKKLPKNVKSIALEYTVILVDNAGNERAVDPAEHTFDVGDSFLVRIRPHDDKSSPVVILGHEADCPCVWRVEQQWPTGE